MIRYVIGNSGQTLVLTDPVLAHFDRYRQVSPRNREAGGQLFATFVDQEICLQRATGPRRTDRRSITSFLPNRFVERKEIKRYFKSGFHYAGDWHTHPELHPTPSHTDIASFRDMFSKSHHHLASFVMIIVETAPEPEGLFVALCNDLNVERLLPTVENF